MAETRRHLGCLGLCRNRQLREFLIDLHYGTSIQEAILNTRFEDLLGLQVDTVGIAVILDGILVHL